jgi:pimeloyl-ACP methyl ester carboxylesterase
MKKALMKKALILMLALIGQLAAMAQPKTKQVLVEGSGRPVVLLHGGTFDMSSLAPHSKLLADSFTVIRMQQFNVEYADQGRTLPESYSVRTESEAVRATLDSLHISGPVILVGHSYGGVVAFDFAINHPERVRSLVLVEAPLFDLARARGKYSEQMKQIDALTGQFTPAAAITEPMLRSFRCKLANCDSIDISRHPNWPKWVAQKDRLRGLSVVPAYKVDLKKLHAFQKPVLLLTGTRTIEPNQTVDRLLGTAFAKAQSGSLPGEHTAIYSNAATFVRLLKGFVQQTE